MATKERYMVKHSDSWIYGGDLGSSWVENNRRTAYVACRGLVSGRLTQGLGRGLEVSFVLFRSLVYSCRWIRPRERGQLQSDLPEGNFLEQRG